MSLRPPHRHGVDKNHQHSSARQPVVASDSNPELDLWGEDDALRKELEELAAQNRALLHSAGQVSKPVDLPLEGVEEVAPTPEAASNELARLREENAALRTRVTALEEMLASASGQAEQLWAEQQREYEVLLEEKSEVIRNLHLKIQELREEASQAQSASGPEDSATVQSLRQEVLQLRQQLERQQQQIEEDEEALREQMKQMELTMSRERVEMARQRAELQRMYQEYQRELEMAQRDGNLRERLAALQRRQQDGQGSGTAPTTPPNSGSTPVQARSAAPTMISLPNANRQTNGSRSTNGLLSKLFGKK